jgi:hypothetical protein
MATQACMVWKVERDKGQARAGQGRIIGGRGDLGVPPPCSSMAALSHQPLPQICLSALPPKRNNNWLKQNWVGSWIQYVLRCKMSI